MESWASLPADVIKQLFKSCGLNINVDGSEDNAIHCFKESKPCATGREMLKSQMEVLKDLEDETNPFLSSISVIDSDIEEVGNEIFVFRFGNEISRRRKRRRTNRRGRNLKRHLFLKYLFLSSVFLFIMYMGITVIWKKNNYEESSD